MVSRPGVNITFSQFTDFKFIIEGVNTLSEPSLAMALHCCFAGNYVFNIIQFPLESSPISFFSEKHVYQLRMDAGRSCIEASCSP